MNYSKIQKILSGLVLFSLLFSITFRIPFFSFFGNVFAQKNNFYNLVSVLVQENIYPSIKSNIERYAKDIQGVLENTRVVILPIPAGANAFQVASMNEALYYDGYKGLTNVSFNSKLIGTVLVGNFPLPVVYDKGKAEKTIIPYVDFEDKQYIFNNETKKYEKNNLNNKSFSAEIWHGVITPNTGTDAGDILAINDYFDKNHDYYTGKGNFKTSNGIINGKGGNPVNYKPYVFYYDQFREEQSINFQNYKGYQALNNNLEDITYNRFSKDLANKVKNFVLGDSQQQSSTLIDNLPSYVDTGILQGNTGPDLSKSSDIQTMTITQKTIKKFIEIFNPTTFGDFKKNVYNAGRYNELGGQVNVDFIPSFISALDDISSQIIKDASNDLETQIDNIVKNGLSRKIAIPQKVVFGGTSESGKIKSCSSEYTNILYGNNKINTAIDCSIYRGSLDNGGTLVEANRGLNVKNIQGDLSRSPLAETQGYWGGNSPLNLDKDQISNGVFRLIGNNLNTSIVSLFDIIGSSSVSALSKTPSPLNCLDNNFILTKSEKLESSSNITDALVTKTCKPSLRLPIGSLSSMGWNAGDINTIGPDYTGKFEDFYKNNPEKSGGGNGSITCNDGVTYSGSVNNFEIRKTKYSISKSTDTCKKSSEDIYSFKFIPSFITHKSPTYDELSKQIGSLITPNLPIDKDRYIDFIDAKGNYKKIKYPYLFRLKTDNGAKLSIQNIDKSLKKILDSKSAFINAIINSSNPSNLSGKDKELYNLLKNGNYPSSNINLYSNIKNKPAVNISSYGETKSVNYYDTLLFALYWKELNSAGAKYKFIFENYLSDQFSQTGSGFNLPRNKKSYEIAYIGAPGTSTDMFVKVDPNGKASNPYASIISKNIDLNAKILGLNIGGGTDSSNLNNKPLFNCAPPQGVPLSKWLPAITCWLKDIVPPKISLSSSTCGATDLSGVGGSFISNNKDQSCNQDLNKNGIYDCLESKLKNGSIKLVSDTSKYYYNSSGIVSAQIKDNTGNDFTIDNTTMIRFVLQKVEAPIDINKDISNTNKKVIFNRDNYTDKSRSLASEYLLFRDGDVGVTRGLAQSQFSTKGKNSNVYIRATIDVKDKNGKTQFSIKSKDILIKIRGDRLFLSSNTIKLGALNINDSMIKVSNISNIYLLDSNNFNLNNNFKSIDNDSLSKEKIILGLSNISKGGKNIQLSYPITIKLFRGKKLINTRVIQKNDLKSFISLYNLEKTGLYNIEITDQVGQKINKEIELLPEAPSKIDLKLGSNIIKSGGNVTSNFVSILDKYNNTVYGNLYNIDFNIKGGGVVFANSNSDILSLQTYEGFRAFKIKSTNNIGLSSLNINLKDSLGKTILKSTQNIKIIDGIKLNVVYPSNIKVGGGEYAINIEVLDLSGNIINDFNSRIYTTINSSYLDLKSPFVNIVAGKAKILFNTKTLSAQNANIEFQIEGINDIFNKTINILPDAPIKVDLLLSSSKLEARDNVNNQDKAILKAELKDRYNNLVFTDNSTNISLESIGNNITNSSKTIKGGVGTFLLNGGINPGITYFKVNVTPPLENNSFVIPGNTPVTINGVSSNAGKYETFYFWNKDKIFAKNYNSIYTTLLGAPYGDITKSGYLAGGLIFDKTNRALSVTSLLNNPYKVDDVISIKNSGNINKTYSSSQLSQDISIRPIIKNNKIFLDLYNNALNKHVGEVYYNFSNNTLLNSCSGTGENLDNCNISNLGSSITMKSVSPNYSSYSAGGNIVFESLDKTSSVSINNLGEIQKIGNISFDIDNLNNKDYLVLNIKNNQDIVGKIAFNFVGSKTKVTRNTTILNNLLKLSNSIIIYIPSSSYASRKIYVSSGATNIYYIDPFSSSYQLNDFSKDNKFAYENFLKKQGIGWEQGNKTLLSFSAGKSVGEATKDYQSFSLINIGDPVISLNKVKKKFSTNNNYKKFDSTIGKLLVKDNSIFAYHIFDYDNNNKDDILIIKQDGYFKLFENTSSSQRFSDEGNLVYAADLGNKDLIKTGDFTGDGYDDIFFVNNKGKPFIFNNNIKNFTRIDLSQNFNIDSRIVSVEKFDMDNDGITDIITLDENGDIIIFYGGGTSKKPFFTKKIIDSGNGLKISSKVINLGSAIYYDGLPKKLPGKDIGVGVVDNTTINSLIFEKVNYPLTGTGELIFIKGEYSGSSKLDIQKRMFDRNKGTLNSGDIIDVEILIRNPGPNKINNIKFLDTIKKVFKFDISTVSIEGNSTGTISSGLGNYDLLVDNLSLAPKKSVKIKYTLTTYPLKYGVFSVGYFEKGEAGDDKFGDILLKEKKQNCSKTEVILRSSSSRSYVKGQKVPTCDANKISLPDNLVDNNNNGIPDTTDNLLKLQSNIQLSLKNGTEINASDLQQLQNFSDQNKSKFIPPPSNNPSILDNLNNINNNTDTYLSDLSKVESAFGCGFGGQGCISTPMNWAPLAPGNDPVLFGTPIGDGFKVDEGLPVFSAMTQYFPTPAGPIPFIWPPISGGAGGYLGTSSAMNFFRLFITPTLTGGVGMAACFGGPASVAGNIPPQGVSPIVPGGNCIVVAAPLLSCNGDGSSGDVRSLGPVSSGGISGGSSAGQFGVINGTCDQSSTPPSVQSMALNPSFVSGYIDILTSGTLSLASLSGLKNTFKSSLNSIGVNNNVTFDLPNSPLLIGFAGAQDKDFIADVDFSSIGEGGFKDIIKIKQNKISSFPDFLMDWVSRQIEEIVVKLTDFPTLFIILPDFSIIFDTYDKAKKAFPNPELAKEAGIKEAYTFLSSLPIINIEFEPVNISIPFFTETEVNKTVSSWTNTAEQWKRELEDKKNSWTLGYTCPVGDTACKEDKQNKLDVISSTSLLIASLEKNISIINGYKDFPKKLNRLMTKKEAYLEQMLCQVESISSMTNGWITENGKRFKSWVELYVLIKAILKSWQLLIDVFVDYSAECKECKNNRGNAQDFLWKQISMAIPTIPVIQFPKWPDIILDLHNIRMGIKIVLPEFKFTNRPVLMPTLPKLILPDTPNANASLLLPTLKILPELNIMDLPDLPTMPSIKLPNLPPPPTLPKMFSSIEGVLNIIKLITKMMCLLKSSPFVPEWRAGEQIAFLTDRSGYLKTDFVSKSTPQASYSSVDAISVTTYVNLETESSFIVDLARYVLAPVNNFSNDITKIFDYQIPDLDLSNQKEIPASVDLQVLKNNKTKQISFISSILAKQVIGLQKYISDNKSVKVSNKDFLSLVNESLSSKIITSDPRLDKLRSVWKEAQDMTYSRENKLIEKLLKNNKEKFSEFRNIINEEKIINNELKKNVYKLGEKSFIDNVVGISDIKKDVYNKRLQKYNDNVILAVLDMQNSGNIQKEELKTYKTDIVSRVKSGMKEFNNRISNNTRKSPKLLSKVSNIKTIKASQAPTPALLSAINVTSSTSNNSNICIASNQSQYKYNYKGIYIVEGSDSYRLFDYTDEVSGNENTTTFNLDSDSDNDLIYSVGDEIFIKENLSIKANKKYISLNPLYLPSNNNKFLNGSTFIEAVNNAVEVSVSDKFINLGFSNNKGGNINNYRLEYYTIIDKRNNLLNTSYTPENIRKTIVDGFAGKEDITKIKETDNYILSDNLGYIRNVGNMSSGTTLKTKELKDIKKDLSLGKAVQLSARTKLYAGDTNFTITYKDQSNIEQIKFVGAFKNIEFKTNVQIIKITGSAYISGQDITLTGSTINTYKGLPVLIGTKLDIPLVNSFTASNNLEIRYYDNSDVLIDFKKVKKYEIIDLGVKSNDYLINLETKNDYFYGKLFSFKNNIFGTSGKNILLSPQKEADKRAPELLTANIIEVPVYQSKKVDFTPSIYENSGIQNIKDIYVDFNLNVDSDLDGNPKNDRDTKNIDIIKTPNSINISFGPYDTLFSKNIGLTMVDNSGNIGYREIPFTVYSPKPKINSYSGSKISGMINESLTSEPVGLYRYRGGSISKISGIGGNNIALTNSGTYDFATVSTSTGLELKYNNSIVANIDETTGKIDLLDPSLSIKILPSNSKLNTGIFPKIIINKGPEEIFYQNINIGDNVDFKVVASFAGLQNIGIYLKFTDKVNYNYYKIPSSVKYSPGVIGIYRSSNPSKEALFSIYPDGRINVINLSNFSLEYSEFNNYVVIKMIDKKFNREVAQLLYRADASYSIK